MAEHIRRRFTATRKHHSKEAAEDYTELIAELIDQKGEARTCDIAAHLGISHVTAIRTMKRLQEEGFLNTTPHQPVVLTQKGRNLASFSKRRHELLLRFFISLGVPEKQAEIDVEGAEHHISAKTLECIERALELKS
jgi:DtxR family manganese transport transcriptional regulator